MRLYRINSSLGQSHSGFQWPIVVGGFVRALDWNPNPKINCGSCLHGSELGDYLSWEYAEKGKGFLYVIDVNDDEAVRASDNQKWRFPRATVVAMYRLDSPEAKAIIRKSFRWGTHYRHYVGPL